MRISDWSSDVCSSDLEGVAEAQPHDRVGEEHRLLLAGVAIDDVDDVRDLLLGEEAVDGLERQLVALRERPAEQHAARRRLEALHILVALLLGSRDEADDLTLQGHGLGLERLMAPAPVGKHPARYGLGLATPVQTGNAW